MKTHIKNLFLRFTLMAGLGLILAGQVSAQTFSDANWLGLGGLGSAVIGQINALACDSSGNLYVESSYANYYSAISKWNGYTWSLITTNTDYPVYALACDHSGNLYVGGAFTTVGGVSASGIAKWNGSAWSPLGSGIEGSVYALAFDKNGNLYAGGGFATAGGVSANNIAKWNGSAWSALGSGIYDAAYNDKVFALVCDTNGNLYAGGTYLTAGGVTAGGIAKWNGSAWSALGSGMDKRVLSLVCDSFGNLYAGGVFSSAGGVSANSIAEWNGSTWSALGSGMSGGDSVGYNDQGAFVGAGPTVNALALDGFGSLYASGNFYEAGASVAYYVAEALLTGISTRPPQVTTFALPNGTNGVAYSQQLFAVNGQLPYRWSIFSGFLPPGLTLANNGVISGMPTNSGIFNFTVKVTDAFSTTATWPLTLTVIGPPSVVIQPTNNSVSVTVGSNTSFAASASGVGPFSYQWQLNGTNLPNGIITTVAGNGISYYYGDGGAATNAELGGPSGVVLDTTGNVFIADAGNNCIRKVGTNGIITTVAGNGRGGYFGDGGAATNAELNDPWSVAVDATGNLFIADQINQRIRKVGTNGIITTMAGNGTNSYSGDGGAATNAEFYYPGGVAVDATGNLFIVDSANSRIRKVGTNGIITTVAGGGYGYSGDGGAATNSELANPYCTAMDATGNLFIADTYNNRIRKVGTNGIITTVVGNGTKSYSGDGGAATNAELNFPADVAVDANGNLFIADIYNLRIRKVVIQGPTLELNNVGFGNAGAYDVVVSSPYGSVTSSVVNLTIFAPLQVTTMLLPNGTNGVAYSQQLSAVNGQLPYNLSIFSGSLPSGVALATNGLISGTPTTNGTFNFTVKVTDALSATVTQSLALTVVVGPPIVAIQPTNNSVTVAVGNNVSFAVSVAGTGPFSYQWQLNGTNLPNGIITAVAGNGTNGYSGDNGAATNAELNYPSGVAMDTSGNLFIADYFNQRIRKIGTNGIITTVAGNGASGYSGDGNAATNAKLYQPSGVVVDATGNLFIADEANNRIRKVGTNGIITTVAGNGTSGYSGDGGAATNAELYYPYDVAVDAFGNLFIADVYNNVVRKMGTNGIITTVAGNGGYGYSGGGNAATNAEFYDPVGVVVDSVGNLFIADEVNERIRKVGTNGIITTVAGNGTTGYFGDSGAAPNAGLHYPEGVAVDAAGNLFIADSSNLRIRKVVNPGIPIPGLTLVLNNVGFGNAGAYDVVVSSPYGSVTSSVVNLTITLPVILSTPKISVGKTNFTFLLSGQPAAIMCCKFPRTC